MRSALPAFSFEGDDPSSGYRPPVFFALRFRLMERARFRVAAMRFTLLRFVFFRLERLPLMAAMSFLLQSSKTGAV